RIAIIGGTGLGDVLLQTLDAHGVQSHDIDTPFGRPSAPIVTGTFVDRSNIPQVREGFEASGVSVALLKRHGEGHLFNPGTAPYRANIFALKALGCTHIIASGAVGSLREDIHPGELVLCDQIIDRTSRRAPTFYERAAVH